ncbi:MAG: glutamyl-tRNA reductase [Bacteroidetes bacterium]|nr:glutamyl-tRNA reductase [Bacteroidota bacterium]
MQGLRAISIHHHHFPLETIGDFSLAEEALEGTVNKLKQTFGIQEIMYLGTCNRIEFIFTLPHYVCPGFAFEFLKCVQPNVPDEVLRGIAGKVLRFNDEETVEHLFRVASGLDSMIVGEQEIITQLRKAYEACENLKATGDDLRLLIQAAIRVGKEVYTETNLSKKPVSIVSIAWNEFRKKQFPHQSRILCVGAGQIIRNFVKFLGENSYSNVHVVNRSLENAEQVARLAAGKASTLSDLTAQIPAADVLVVCTGSQEYIIQKEHLEMLVDGNSTEKMVIDLALPNNVHPDVLNLPNIDFVDMVSIQKSIHENIAFREESMEDGIRIVDRNKNEFKKMVQSRNVERVMRAIPETIKGIKQTAVELVFKKEIDGLNEETKALVLDIIQYMEKKYISVPMKMAKDVLLEEISKN